MYEYKERRGKVMGEREGESKRENTFYISLTVNM